MRLLHLLTLARRGGCELNALRVLRASAEHDCRCVVLGPSGPLSERFAEISRLSHLDALERPVRSMARALRGELAGERFDGAIYWSTTRLPSVRWALEQASDRLLVHVGNPIIGSARLSLRQRLMATLWRAQLATGLFPASAYVERTLAGDPVLARLPSRVLLNPVDLLDANPHRPRSIGEGDALTLGMVARLDPIKDHACAIRALAAVRRSLPGATLQLVGDGLLLQPLRALTESLGLGDAVRFLGARDDVYAHLQRWDLMLFASGPREGLGNAVIEAMACGLPVVASDLPPLREIAGESCAARWAPAGDAAALARAVVELAADLPARRRMSDAGFARAAAAFSPSGYVSRLLDWLLTQEPA